MSSLDRIYTNKLVNKNALMTRRDVSRNFAWEGMGCTGSESFRPKTTGGARILYGALGKLHAVCVYAMLSSPPNRVNVVSTAGSPRSAR